MYLITVSLPEPEQFILKFHVLEYKNAKGRITFIDTHTGYLKDFPSEWCAIEEVK